MSIQAKTIEQQRRHKAALWRNIRYHEQQHLKSCTEHAKLLRIVFGPLLEIKLPRVPKPIK